LEVLNDSSKREKSKNFTSMMKPETEINMALPVSDILPSQGSLKAADEVEVQLSKIISSAQQIAIIAEELLREFSANEISAKSNGMTPARLRQTIQAAAVAPRLLSATQQQLDSLHSMLRME
jgi:hypothetical protein